MSYYTDVQFDYKLKAISSTHYILTFQISGKATTPWSIKPTTILSVTSYTYNLDEIVEDVRSLVSMITRIDKYIAKSANDFADFTTDRVHFSKDDTSIVITKDCFNSEKFIIEYSEVNINKLIYALKNKRNHLIKVCNEVIRFNNEQLAARKIAFSELEEIAKAGIIN